MSRNEASAGDISPARMSITVTTGSTNSGIEDLHLSEVVVMSTISVISG